MLFAFGVSTFCGGSASEVAVSAGLLSTTGGGGAALSAAFDAVSLSTAVGGDACASASLLWIPTSDVSRDRVVDDPAATVVDVLAGGVSFCAVSFSAVSVVVAAVIVFSKGGEDAGEPLSSKVDVVDSNRATSCGAEPTA